MYDGLALASGHDPFTGEALSPAQMGLFSLALVLPFISGHDLSLADEALGWEWADNAVETACSFSADTPVATAHGETAISAIHTGDQVLAYNEQTGDTGYYTVTATLKHADPAVVHLTLDGEPIETTPEHPFYQINATAWWRPGQWTPAGQLHQGDWVRKADAQPVWCRRSKLSHTPR